MANKISQIPVVDKCTMMICKETPLQITPFGSMPRQLHFTDNF